MIKNIYTSVYIVHVVSDTPCSVLFFDGCVPEADGVPVDCDGCVLVYMMRILIAV